MRRIVLALIAIAVLAGLAYRFLPSGSDTATKKSGPQPVPVRLAPVALQDVALRIELTGRTEADATVTLKSRIDGQVLAVPFTEGQHVAAGEVLIRLDPADMQAKLAQAAANLARSHAQAVRAQADLERYTALRDKGFISAEKLNEIRTNTAAAASTEKADAATVEIARLQHSYTTLRAPFAGVVGARLVFPGATVKTNDTALAVINRLQPLKVAFAIPEKYLPQIRARLQDDKQPLQAVITRPDGVATEARVGFLDNSVDAASGTILLKAVLPNADEALTPGQFVNVGLLLDTLRQVATVPAEAVQQGSAGSYVFLAQDGKVALRQVRIATVQDGRAAIAEGITAGDTVVTEGHLRLTDGAQYRDAAVKPEAGKAEKGGAKAAAAAAPAGPPNSPNPPR